MNVLHGTKIIYMYYHKASMTSANNYIIYTFFVYLQQWQNDRLFLLLLFEIHWIPPTFPNQIKHECL